MFYTFVKRTLQADNKNAYIINVEGRQIWHNQLGLGLWCLTPHSTIFQLYRGGQFYWWRKP